MKAFDERKYTEARALLSQGVDVDAQDKMGNTALTFLIDAAGNSGPFPLDILKTVLQRAHNPNPTIYSEFSTPPDSNPTLDVSLMANGSADATRLADMRQVVQLLLAHGARFQGASGPTQEILQAATRGDSPMASKAGNSRENRYGA
jgi:ankyrin repeat protein